MKINEVEALAGITKKNIRFYEDQGLLTPRRNAENGYREYGEEEVTVLRQIRLLRKLDVPIEEIRQMFNGTHTVGDGMRRHLITLEREQRNLQHAIELCRELAGNDMPIARLDTEQWLERMEQLENSGTAFQNVLTTDIRRRYYAPTVITVAVVLLMGALSALLLWARSVSPEDAPPLWIVAVTLVLFAAIGIGTVIALTQCISEIRKGEMEDAKKY